MLDNTDEKLRPKIEATKRGHWKDHLHYIIPANKFHPKRYIINLKSPSNDPNEHPNWFQTFDWKAWFIILLLLGFFTFLIVEIVYKFKGKPII